MGAWHIALQTASYKNVPFEVLAIDENNQKAIIAHSYPYVDNADLEDMGLQAHSVRLSAVFFGYCFEQRLKKLLAVLTTQGPGILMHPIMGRMPDMLLESYSIRYHAEDVNYVSLDLALRKSTPGNPIFAYSRSLVVQLDSAFAELNTFIASATNTLSDAINTMLVTRSEITAWQSAAQSLFDALSPLHDKTIVQAAGLASIVAGIQTVVDAVSATNTYARLLNVEDDDDNANGVVDKSEVKNLNGINAIMTQLQSHDQLLHTSKIASGQLPYTLRLLSRDKLQLLPTTLTLLSTSELMAVAYTVFDAVSTLTPHQINDINAGVRLRIQQTIAKIAATSVLCDETRYTLREGLRDRANTLNILAQTAINRNPPLCVKTVAFDATMHQLAFRYYGDLHYANELIRLNPHIIHPSFIEKGSLINAYAKN